jgi:hypothetical protein
MRLPRIFVATVARIAAGAVAGHHQRHGLAGEIGEVVRSPADGVLGIFKPGAERMLRRKPIVWHQHGATAACRKGARHRIKIVDFTEHPSAAMQIDDEPGRGLRPVQTRRDRAGPGAKVEVANDGQLWSLAERGTGRAHHRT